MSDDRFRVGAVAVVATFLCVSTLFGHGMIPRDVPVARVLANLEAHLKEHPDDAATHWRLGRFHGLAYETKSSVVLAWASAREDSIVTPTTRGWLSVSRPEEVKDKDGKPIPPPTDDELRTHLVEAIRHLNKAIQLDPHRPEFRVAMASILESGEKEATRIDMHPLVGGVDLEDEKMKWTRSGALSPSEDAVRRAIGLPNPNESDWPTPASNRGVAATILWSRLQAKDPPAPDFVRHVLIDDWRNQIAEQYFMAMCLALPEEGKMSTQPIWGTLDDEIAYESAKGFLRIVTALGTKPSDHVRTIVAAAVIKGFDTLPRSGAITPIIFSLESSAARGTSNETGSLDALLDSSATSTFDLDGSGRPQRWSWVRPGASILVWDPEHTGRITSGRQLFGNATFWLFFDDGYQALSVLDDDRDGWLRGAEVDGLALWNDRNGNGASDEGEVVPIERTPIRAIATRADAGARRTLDCAAACERGLILKESSTRPTYDWIARAATAVTSDSALRRDDLRP